MLSADELDDVVCGSEDDVVEVDDVEDDVDEEVDEDDKVDEDDELSVLSETVCSGSVFGGFLDRKNIAKTTIATKTATAITEIKTVLLTEPPDFSGFCSSTTILCGFPSDCSEYSETRFTIPSKSLPGLSFTH